MPITSIIEQQIPEFIRHDTDGHHFLTFLEYYYKFLSKSWDVEIGDLRDVSIELLQNETENSLRSERGEVYQQLISLKEMRDIDTTPVSLVSNFVSEYMDGVNAPALDSIRSNMKLMKNFYASKGNENSFHFLFNLLYDEVITISYPYEKTLKLSESNWIDRDFVRVDSSLISSAVLDKALNTSIGNGILRSYEYNVVVSSDKKYQKGYYSLEISDVVGEFTDTSVVVLKDTVDEITVNLLGGLSEIQIWNTVDSTDTFDGFVEPYNIYPSDKISIINESSATPELQFGARAEIEFLKEFSLDDSDNITISLSNSVPGKVNMVDDYFSIYEYDLEQNSYVITISSMDSIGNLQYTASSANDVWGNSNPDLDFLNSTVGDEFTVVDVILENTTLQGIRSGSTATVVAKESDKLWVENIEGTFLSDYQLNENGSSESVLILDENGDEVGRLKVGRKYTACVSPASIIVENGVIKLLNPGKRYIFKPYIKDDVINIFGLGKFDREKLTDKTIGIKIINKGIGYAAAVPNPHADSNQPYNNDYKITINGTTQIGYGKIGTVGAEKYMESTLNTLDGEAKLRDSNYYQEFSYEILSTVPMDIWGNPVRKLLHPAGMLVFGKDVTVSSPFDLSLTDQFPSWSTFQSLVNISTPASYSVTYTTQSGSMSGVTNVIPISNNVELVYDMIVNQNSILDSVTRYSDIISRLFFVDVESGLEIESGETNIRVAKNLSFHEESDLDVPKYGDSIKTLLNFNNVLHSINSASILKGKLELVNSFIGRSELLHQISNEDELLGDGNSGSTMRSSNYTLFSNDDSSTVDSSGQGNVGGFSQVSIHKIDDDGLMGGIGSGTGVGLPMNSKFLWDDETDVAEASGESSFVVSMGIKTHKQIPYYSSFSDLGDS